MAASSAPMTDPSLLELMQAAKPKLEWSEKYLVAALDKLEKAGIASFSDLEGALEDNGQLLNENIAASGFKKFHSRTLLYLKNYIQEERMRQRHKLQKLQAQLQKVQAQIDQNSVLDASEGPDDAQRTGETAAPGSSECSEESLGRAEAPTKDATEGPVVAQQTGETAATSSSVCLEESPGQSEAPPKVDESPPVYCAEPRELVENMDLADLDRACTPQELSDAPDAPPNARRLSAPLPPTNAQREDRPPCKSQRRVSAPPSALYPVQHSVEEIVPVPPVGECWDWPLTRIEKKARVQMFDRMILVSENRELHEQLQHLQDEHLCHTEFDGAEGDLHALEGDLQD